MGATKYEIYNEEIVHSADLLKALGHPARLKALLLIANETDRDITAKEIAREIKLSQSTLSVHLKQLRDTGLVKTSMVIKNNKSSLSYQLDKAALKQLMLLLEHLTRKSELKQDDRFESLQQFYSKFKVLINWNQSFDS